MGIDRWKRERETFFCLLARLSPVVFPVRSLADRRETAVENSPTTSDIAKREEKEETKRGFPFSFASSGEQREEEKNAGNQQIEYFKTIYANLVVQHVPKTKRTKRARVGKNFILGEGTK